MGKHPGVSAWRDLCGRQSSALWSVTVSIQLSPRCSHRQYDDLQAVWHSWRLVCYATVVMTSALLLTVDNNSDAIVKNHQASININYIRKVITRLHDRTNIEQTSSKR